jgi:hypothetical protein
VPIENAVAIHFNFNPMMMMMLMMMWEYEKLLHLVENLIPVECIKKGTNFLLRDNWRGFSTLFLSFSRICSHSTRGF